MKCSLTISCTLIIMSQLQFFALILSFSTLHIHMHVHFNIVTEHRFEHCPNFFICPLSTINYYTPTFEKRMLSFTKSRSSVDKMSYKGSKSLMEVDWSFLGILLKVGIFFKILTIIFNMERRLCPLYET